MKLWRRLNAWSRRVDYPRRSRRGLAALIPTRRQTIAGSFIGTGAFLIITALWLQFLPVPTPNAMASAQLSSIRWSDGTAMASVGIANRDSVPLSAIPDSLQAAVLAAEDREFYKHTGFSIRGIGRALFSNVTGGPYEGGSTITQQYAKNAYLSHDRTIVRKVRELFLALKLETRTDKKQILRDYLNTIWFGRNSYGVKQAARSYFAVRVQDLTIAQSAVLAAVIRAPGLYDPRRHPAKLRKRWGYVLDSMVDMGVLSARARAAQKFPYIVSEVRRQRYFGPRGFILESVQQELLRIGFTQREIDLGGLQVRTTFDQKAQEALEEAITDRGPRTGTDGLRIGAVAVRPGTGEVAAMWGGADYLSNQLNNATDAIGQAGSVFKPFALAAALEKGVRLDSVWNGNSGTNFGDYRVRNFGGSSFGRTTLLNGTVHSVNTVYVGVTEAIGPDAVVDAAHRAGIPKDTPALEPVLSVPLGTCSPHAMDLANAYATFAAHGVRATPTMVAEVRNAAGRIVYRHKARTARAFSRAVADSVTYALQRVVWSGTGVGASRAGRSVAGKTGTTNESKAAWFVGYTPTLAAAIMFTKEDSRGRPITLNGTGGLGSFTGGSFPARIWGTFIAGAYRGERDDKFQLDMSDGSGGWAGGFGNGDNNTGGTGDAPVTPSASYPDGQLSPSDGSTTDLTESPNPGSSSNSPEPTSTSPGTAMPTVSTVSPTPARSQ